MRQKKTFKLLGFSYSTPYSVSALSLNSQERQIRDIYIYLFFHRLYICNVWLCCWTISNINKIHTYYVPLKTTYLLQVIFNCWLCCRRQGRSGFLLLACAHLLTVVCLHLMGRRASLLEGAASLLLVINYCCFERRRACRGREGTRSLAPLKDEWRFLFYSKRQLVWSDQKMFVCV